MSESSSTHGWIDLLLADGPFLSPGALDASTVGERWPTRLDAAQRLLLRGPRSDVVLGDVVIELDGDDLRHRVESILTELLGYRSKKTLDLAPSVVATHHIYRAKVRADFVVHATDDPGDVRMVVMCDPQAIAGGSHRTTNFDGWISTPVQRAALLARHAGANLALLSDGYQHLLVNVVTGTTGSATWTSSGLEDKSAQDAFVALLHKERVLHRQTPTSKLIELSQDRQQELTKTLGRQVRRAAEVLVNAISRANRTTRGELLAGVAGPEVYSAATRVLMRTVFLLLAEERGLLPVAENQLYAKEYAVSTLLDRLEEDEYRNRSAMQRRSGAWQRLLALSRALYSGVDHDSLRLAAYGGDLFNPKIHLFLEGLMHETPREHGEQSVRALDVGVVDDYTVLTVLRHLQVADGQRISFRSLDVEQVGHVYESLLDHSAVVVQPPDVAVLGLVGRSGDEPEVSIERLEAWKEEGETKLLKELSSLGVASDRSAVRALLAESVDPDSDVARTISISVGNDDSLGQRVLPFLPLLRTDARGVALVFLPGDVYVTETSSKRDSGTAYTPRSLADQIAKHTLDPLIHEPGPRNEPDRSKWKLKSPAELLALRVCDPAVGSAAILVAAVRYLADALLQSRIEIGDLPEDALETAAADVDSLGVRIDARRDVVSKCIYGVDRDPMAVEMAKLSLWLVTMARDRPFTFLDHAIQHGDSLLGLTSLDQLRRLHLDENSDIFGRNGGGLLADDSVYEWRRVIDETISEASNLRKKLRQLTVNDVHDALEQARLHEAAQNASAGLRAVADSVTAACLSTAAGNGDAAAALTRLTASIVKLDHPETREQLVSQAAQRAEVGNPNSELRRAFFHWPLAFPEVWEDGHEGFDCIVGNPPFVGGSKISGAAGDDYRAHLVRYVARRSGNADLVAYFFLRAAEIAHGFGFIATNSVAQATTRQVGLRRLAAPGEGAITRAVAMLPWPGAANVHVSLVWWSRHLDWPLVTLDGLDVPAIESDLWPVGKVRGEPFALPSAPYASEGVKLYGEGFVLDADEAEQVLEQDPRNEEVVRPYLSGRDLNQVAGARPSRWCINFHNRSLAQARSYEAPFRIVEERVLPYRRTVKSEQAREYWWQPERTRDDLIRRLAAVETTVAVAMVSSRVIPLRVPSSYVFSNGMALIPDATDAQFAVLNSTINRVWVDRYASTMKSDIRYSPSNVLENFPFPSATTAVEAAMAEIDEWRTARMLELGEGVTALYGRYHDSSGSGETAERLRQLHMTLDQAVLEAYEWNDVDLGHGFHETRYGTFFTVSREARFEILMRLLELNFIQYSDQTGGDLETVKREAEKVE